MFKKYIFLVLMVLLSFSISLTAYADDEEMFSSVAPDALIVLDTTGSMDWNPAGTADRWGDANCAGPFYGSSGEGHTTDCRRIEIAKRAIFSILDDDNNGTINTQDSNSLGIRIGFMTFGGVDNALVYNDGNIIVRRVISALGSTGTGTPYQTTYCGASTSGSCTINSSGGSSTVAGQSASGGTPLANALREAKAYLDIHKTNDTKAKTCRKKFVILISDGADTYACTGDGAECQAHMYKKRRATVAAAKQLRDAGYKVYVIGFGAGMPAFLKNNLNWLAYYGGTDNPEVNSGPLPPDVQAYQMDLSGCDPDGDPPVTTSCCVITGSPGSETTTGICFPPGITSCQTDSTTYSATCQSGLTAQFRANHNDPGYYNYDYIADENATSLSGFAFLASNTDDLIAALRIAIIEISGASYSFTQSSVQTIRTIDESYLYEASFTPVLTPNNDSFWPGYLKRYTILNAAGLLKTPEDWDAGDILKLTPAGNRNVWTLKSNTITAFNTSNITIADLGITGGTAAQQEAKRQEILTYIRGGEQGGANKDWKMGDIFHSAPITIGTPSLYFYDRIDTNDPSGFEGFRGSNERTTDNAKRLIVAGANDAQFHVFKAAHSINFGGKEIWSFLPPNFMPRLPSAAHGATHPTSCLHQYFVDGPTTGADVWWGTDQTHKSAGEWHTILVMSEGRGGISKLWSSSASCDTGLVDAYVPATTTPATVGNTNYCGYYAFDVTHTTLTTPSYIWKLGGKTSGLSATHGKHLGQPWSKISTGRVLYSGKEKWVGFVGGGFSKTECSGGGSCDPKGKGFYVVDTYDGSILWSSTHSGPDGVVNGYMDYGLAGQAATLDFDNDGFIDTAYIADMGGNVWRFKFCLKSEPSCTWSGERLFNSVGNVRPIYSKPAVSRDPTGNVWVYFGTGDATDPTATNAQERFYAVIDANRSGTYVKNDLKGISGVGTSVFTPSTDIPTYDGWYMDMPGMGIKILGDPIVFFGVVAFTTYAPSNSTNLCEKSGDNRLYGLDYISGAGQYVGQPYVDLPHGPPVSVQGSIDDATGKLIYFLGKDPRESPGGGGGGRTNLLYWRDNRVQP